MKGSTLSPAKKLTQPSVGFYNSGVDNQESDLIVSVGDILTSDIGSSDGYEGPRDLLV